ncbi:rhamnogalacturonan acetylesterase [Thalassoglobus sp.]|uniref:rhamnogalacturonan acetylesterase n=1 Tax=Thalassoglobus sp. TaxID=2795869 RepID=UPI003AA8427C
MTLHQFNKLARRQIFFCVAAALMCRCGMADDKPVTIVLAGDSTVTDTAGWGKGFSDLLNEKAKCVNLSAGGRSSKSFRAEGRWQKCLDLKPDYILIQFGHNDQPGKGEARETDPATTYPEFLKQYVIESREIGATPILITSLTRRRFNEQGKITSTLTPYVAAVKKVGKELNVPVVDLHTRSIELCEKLGPEKCIEISYEQPKGGLDRTHLNTKGAQLTAPLIVDELDKVAPEMSKYFESK